MTHADACQLPGWPRHVPPSDCPGELTLIEQGSDGLLAPGPDVASRFVRVYRCGRCPELRVAMSGHLVTNAYRIGSFADLVADLARSWEPPAPPQGSD